MTTISDLKHVEAELVGLFSRLKAPCLFTMRISPQSTSGIDIFYGLDFFIFVNIWSSDQKFKVISSVM